MPEEEILWKDRKHHMWFPFSFTKYSVSKTSLQIQQGFFKTSYDETLLYRIVDLRLSRTLAQKFFGTGTIELFTRVDTQHVIQLKNIKHSKDVRRLLSTLIEQVRNEKNVVGKEFYGIMGGGMHHDMDGMDDPVDMDADGIPDAIQ
ncbi:MAG: PH domain-containing protein [Lachnospiraceae bacterium]|nr:PH domain-containing protein [Lachnospiraceae bacterium]